MFKGPKIPAPPAPPPPPPTIDDARQREEGSRRYGRRKGGLANMFAGGASAPSGAIRQALGVSAGP